VEEHSLTNNERVGIFPGKLFLQGEFHEGVDLSLQGIHRGKRTGCADEKHAVFAKGVCATAKDERSSEFGAFRNKRD